MNMSDWKENLLLAAGALALGGVVVAGAVAGAELEAERQQRLAAELGKLGREGRKTYEEVEAATGVRRAVKAEDMLRVIKDAGKAWQYPELTAQLKRWAAELEQFEAPAPAPTPRVIERRDDVDARMAAAFLAMHGERLSVREFGEAASTRLRGGKVYGWDSTVRLARSVATDKERNYMMIVLAAI